jgi:hypothetical protein
VALLTISLQAAWRVWRFREGEDWKDVNALGLGLFISLIVMLLHGLVDAVTWGTKPSVIPWLVMGLSVAADNLTKAENSELCHMESDGFLKNASPVGDQVIAGNYLRTLRPQDRGEAALRDES